MLSFSANGSAAKAWAKDFEAAMLASGHPAFDSIKGCKIGMTAAPVAPASDSDIPVQVKAMCKGVDYKKAPLSEMTLSAQLLQQAFNAAHEALDDGDQILGSKTQPSTTAVPTCLP